MPSTISSAALQRFECVDAVTYAPVSVASPSTGITSAAAATCERSKFFVCTRKRRGCAGLSRKRREDSDVAPLLHGRHGLPQAEVHLSQVWLRHHARRILLRLF